ncbi:hypothetical protein [Hoylesella saccharolytica]|jgi:hypothetical protein|uniref:hypothetical protein n=1 Tax=Hoylesella saccharolytica TaxID=633701 RepID=UPI0004718693|nr:hypothetical protein [Hoylesella saccharolytica]
MDDDKLLNQIYSLMESGGTPSKSEEKRYVDTKAQIEIASLFEELVSKQQDRQQRGKFAGHIFILMCIYLALAIIIVMLKGCQLLTLSDIVTNVLLSTTTANVIGIFAIVAKYLFHR